jgi:ankyrin repeat protein
MTYLNNFVAKGDLQTVRTLIENQGYSPNYTGWHGFAETPLVTAAQFGQRKVLDYLIQKGADVDGRAYFGFTPIETALKFGHTQVVASLLANNAFLPEGIHKTDVANQYLLKAATTNDTWSIEKLLAHTEADINTHDNFMKRTPLHNAVMSDSFDATHTLVEKGAKINAIDINGWTSLHYAASNSDTQFASFLIEKGAKINALDNNNRTPLFTAVLSGEEELINLLVKNGAKVNHTDKDNISALDISIINDDSAMIKCLVANGAKISADATNSTPLEFAAETGKLQAVEALIQMGSSMHHKNSEGKTALELAFKAGEMGAVNMLKLYGAEVPAHIQVKLDEIKAVELTKVISHDQDQIISPAELTNEEHNAYPKGETIAEIIYVHPIGPVMGSCEDHEHSFGG